MIGPVVKRGAGQDPGADQRRGQRDHGGPAAPRQATQVARRRRRRAVPDGLGFRMEDRPEVQAGLAATHLLVTRASPAAMGNDIGVLTGLPVATTPPEPPEPTQETFQKTITDAAYMLFGWPAEGWV